MNFPTFTTYRNERSFLIREINELEQRLNDAQLQLKHNKEILHSRYSQKLESENKYWEREILKLELALEEKWLQLRMFEKDYRSTIHAY